MRVGLGYVKGVREEEMASLAAARERGGPFTGVADLASRSGAGRDGLERLAWAGALDGIPLGAADDAAGRREALWQVGVAPSGRGAGEGAQLALPLEPPAPPELEPLGEWETMIADYRSTGMALGEHPLALMRDGLPSQLLRSTDLAGVADGSEVEVAGMVVARQRPETAKGIVFMLFEDERGTVNLIVPPPVYERHRALVRAAPLLRARGRLERREGVVNILVSEVCGAAARALTGSCDRETLPMGTVGRHTTSRRAVVARPSPSCGRSRPPATASAAAGGDLPYVAGPAELAARDRAWLGHREELEEAGERPLASLDLGVAGGQRDVEGELAGDDRREGARVGPDRRGGVAGRAAKKLDPGLVLAVRRGDQDVKDVIPEADLVGPGARLARRGGIEERAQCQHDRVGADLRRLRREGRAGAPGAEAGHDRLQLPAPIGQLVDRGRGRRRQPALAHHAALLKLTETLCQDVRARVRQPVLEVREALRAEQQFTHDEQRPPLADKVEGVGEPTCLAVGALRRHGPILPAYFFFASK